MFLCDCSTGRLPPQATSNKQQSTSLPFPLPKWTLLPPLLCRDSIELSVNGLSTSRHRDLAARTTHPQTLYEYHEPEPAFGRRSYKMPSLVIPESGLSLQSFPGAASKAGSAPPDVFGLTLSDAMIEEMIQCVQNGKGLQLSTGEHPVSLPFISGCCEVRRVDCCVLGNCSVHLSRSWDSPSPTDQFWRRRLAIVGHPQ